MKNIYQAILNGNNTNNTAEILQEIFKILDEISKKNGFQYFLLGASARNYWIQGITQKPRTTKDIDLALQLKNNQEFENITQELIKHQFQKTDNKFRFLYKKIPVDIIPFGEIETDKQYDANKEITSAFGLEEAYKLSEKVQESGIIINIITLEDFFLLKLLAWNDRPEHRHKDAEDMCFILSNFRKINENVIYEPEYSDLLDYLEPENEYSVMLLAKKLKKILEFDSFKQKIIEILEKQTQSGQISQLSTAMKNTKIDYETILNLLKLLLEKIR